MAKPSIKVNPNDKFFKKIKTKNGVLRTNTLKIGRKLSKFKLNRKGITTSIVAISLSILALAGCGKKAEKVVVDDTPKKELEAVDVVDTNEEEKIEEKIKEELNTIDIESLGKRGASRHAEKVEFGDVTGDIVKEDIVKGDDGYLYATEEDKDKSEKIGEQTTETETQTDTGYEIIGEDGNIEASGDEEVPPGYDEETLLPEGYVYCDANYYDEEGNLILAEGDVVTVETLEFAKMYLTTNPNQNTETQEPVVEEPTYDEGTHNPDGTYTKDGLTFESYEDYQQWVLQGYTGYGLDDDGIMRPIVDEDIIGENSYQLIIGG